MPDYTRPVNSASRTVRTDADTPLLYVLRSDFDLNSPKYGCGLTKYCANSTLN